MTELPSSLTYFGSLTVISQVLTKSALPLIESHQLNDAFLPNKNTPMPFSIDELFDISVKFITHAILGREAPKGLPNHPLQKAIMRWRMENRFNDELEIKETLEGLLPSMLSKLYREAESCHNRWIDYVSSKRVVPLFDKYQELALWEAESIALRGGAIKFKCPEDSIFAQCSPVNYKKMPALTVNAQSYVEQMIGVRAEIEFNPKEILLTQNYAHRKLKEWRLISDSHDALLTFPPALIQSVYLGPLVSDSNADKLNKHLAKLYPNVNVYHIQCKSNEYKFDFKKISEEFVEAKVKAE